MIFTVYHPPCSPFPSLRFFIGQQKIHKLQEKFPTVVEGGRGGEGEREQGGRKTDGDAARAVAAAAVGGTRKRRERKVESHRAGRGSRGRAEANNVSGLPQCSQSGRRSRPRVRPSGPWSPQNLPAKTRWMKFALPSLVSWHHYCGHNSANRAARPPFARL